MAVSVIPAGPEIIIEKYSKSWSCGITSSTGIAASALGISAKTGYSIGAVKSWYSGHNNKCVAWFNGTTSGTVMRIKDETQSSDSGTAEIEIMWIRDDLIDDQTQS